MQNRAMTGESWRVLGVLFEDFEWTNTSGATTEDLMARTGMLAPAVSRAVRRLQDIGVVEQYRKGVYHIKSTYFFAGQQRDKHQRQMQEKRLHQQKFDRELQRYAARAARTTD